MWDLYGRVGLEGISYSMHSLFLAEWLSVDKAKGSEQSGSGSSFFADRVGKVLGTGSDAKFTKKPQQAIHLVGRKLCSPTRVFAKSELVSVQYQWLV